MFVLYFNNLRGNRAFIASMDDESHVMSMAKILSKGDPREVLVVENRLTGDTTVRAVFNHGLELNTGRSDTGFRESYLASRLTLSAQEISVRGS